MSLWRLWCVAPVRLWGIRSGVRREAQKNTPHPPPQQGSKVRPCIMHEDGVFTSGLMLVNHTALNQDSQGWFPFQLPQIFRTRGLLLLLLSCYSAVRVNLGIFFSLLFFSACTPSCTLINAFLRQQNNNKNNDKKIMHLCRTFHRPVFTCRHALSKQAHLKSSYANVWHLKQTLHGERTYNTKKCLILFFNAETYASSIFMPLEKKKRKKKKK